MKILDELELRRGSLLNYYERICLSNEMEDRIFIRDVDDALFLLDNKIKEVKNNKVKFIDNPQIVFDWLSEFNGVYKEFN
jgi:hypothetical protein